MPAAGDHRTLEAILDTKSTPSMDLRTNTKLELILLGQSVPDPLHHPEAHSQSYAVENQPAAAGPADAGPQAA